MANFIPKFKDGKITSKPLYGAQQIPGNDSSLRASDVSFVGDKYARCEIVKASSVLSMADDILNQLRRFGYIENDVKSIREFKSMDCLREHEVGIYAESLCQKRGYPISLAHRNTKESNKSI